MADTRRGFTFFVKFGYLLVDIFLYFYFFWLTFEKKNDRRSRVIRSLRSNLYKPEIVLYLLSQEAEQYAGSYC